MKKITLAFAALLLFSSGCGWLYQSGAAENGTDLSDSEIYVNDFSYTNQHEETVTNEELEGEYWVANMVFSRCPTVCNIMTPNMASLQGDLETEGLDTTLVSFTVDPEFDDPEQLQSYGESYNADFSSWHFLTGYEEEEIETLAEESFLSVVEPDQESGDIIHSTQFYLVDPEGQVIRQYDGLEDDTEPILEDIGAVQS
ncbi:SCO family protein [Natribacillus halophilus]|uniref:Protein SCO1/2 n=1 Tax=Natribacillus halophilus TaxID=549003 RepID=A0A1G8LHX9_9BACI|nr:SCO family protein [Natribacillus halophilus]SDI55276.1 protein SCO1/2 [Natribacillus halophilus]